MKTSKLLSVLVSMALLLVLIAWMAGAFHDKIPAKNAQTPAPVEPSGLFTVQAQEQIQLERVAATVNSQQATYVSARIMARIEKIHVHAGEVVSAGQLLVELDQRDLSARLQQAQQAMAAATAQITEAEKDFARINELYEQKVVSKAEVDKTRARRDTLAAEARRAGKALEEAEASLSYSRIVASQAGRVVDHFLQPGDTAAPGQHILSLYNPGAMRVEANVREGLAVKLATGLAMEAYLPSLKHQVPVTLEELVPAADPGARTLLVKASLPLGLEVLPGMYAELLIPAGSVSLLAVPKTALGVVGQQTYVQVWDGQSLQRRFVRLGRDLGDQVVVTSGLDAGEKIQL